MAETATERAERERVEAERAEAERRDRVEADMHAAEFTVVAPYVTLRVKDALGVPQIRGFYEGGTVKRDEIEDASLRHHLDSGLVAPVGSARARFAGPAGTPKPGEPPNVPVEQVPVDTLPLEERLRRQTDAADKAESDATNQRDGRPSRNAPKDDWVTYAVSQRAEGVSEADARETAEFKTKADLVAEFGS